MQWAHSQKEESPELIQKEVWVQLSGRAAAYHAGRVKVQSPGGTNISDALILTACIYSSKQTVKKAPEL